MSESTPGWQPDPTGKHDHRYWDGAQWTENVSDAGVASTDPYEAAASASDATVADAPVAAADVPGSSEPPVPDATAAWPTAADAPASWPTTSGAPAAPPPYVPANPVSAGGGGSKRGLLVGGGILAAIAVAVVAVLALGGDDDEGVRAELASKLEAEGDGEITGGQAECVADLLVDEAGEDAFKDLDFNADEPPAEVLEAFLAVGVDKLVEECGIDEAALGGSDGSTDASTDASTDSTDGTGGEGAYGSDPDLDALYDDCEGGDFAACDELYNESPLGSEYEDFGDTCGERNEPQSYCVTLYEGGGGDDSGGLTDSSGLPPDYEESLADTYESIFDLSRDKAECLADKLVTAIERGSIDENQVATEIFDYLSDCDISMEEIGAN